MASSNEAGFDLRENYPLSRNILHISEVVAHRYTGQRVSQKVVVILTGCRCQLSTITDKKGLSKKPVYLVDTRDSAKSGLGRSDNRHLHYLVEFIFVVRHDAEEWNGRKFPWPVQAGNEPTGRSLQWM